MYVFACVCVRMTGICVRCKEDNLYCFDWISCEQTNFVIVDKDMDLFVVVASEQPFISYISNRATFDADSSYLAHLFVSCVCVAAIVYFE